MALPSGRNGRSIKTSLTCMPSAGLSTFHPKMKPSCGHCPEERMIVARKAITAIDGEVEEKK